MSYRLIEPEPFSPALGAVVRGIDLTDALGDDVVEEIHRAFLEFGVLFFRDQCLDPASLSAFGKKFGELDRYPFVAGLSDHPEVVAVTKKPDEKINFGGLWHTDTSYLARPPMASILFAKTVPPIGGDTLFSNMYLAYEALSEGMRRMLEGVRALNTAERSAAATTRIHRIADNPLETNGNVIEAMHPIIRTHPETGRKSLYCSDAHTARLEDMTEEESAPILKYLYTVQQRPEFTCRFRWREGSLAFWDNRCTQHNALNDYHGALREMYRITLAGDVPA
jgi:taurine dioxygenase